MISRLAGTLISKHPPLLVIDVNGVGYEVEAPLSVFYDLPETGKPLVLLTHLSITDTAHTLYGFASEAGMGDPVGWAMGTLGFDLADQGQPPKDEIQQRFRELLRTAHPDTAEDEDDFDPAQRIADLTEARRILLSA